MIQTRDLAFAHPGAATLVFADLDVAQGGTLLLRGASGAGKSTWLSLAAGLRSPSAGQITVAGQALGYQGMSMDFAVRGVCVDCATGTATSAA